MRPARRSILHALGAAALLGLGAGCARIPTDSGIDSQVLPGQSHPGAPYVRALPPSDGATAQEVLAGFVQAGVGSEDDFAVARAYLTEAESERWDPSAGITVYSGSQELRVEEVGEGRLSLVLQVVASVDGTGVRSMLPSASSREVEVAVEEVEDQWRLSEVPDGIFLSEAAFETLYAPARLYFLDARSRHLVPDHRFVPLRRGAAAVLEGLVAGPAPFLEGAVRSQVPRSADIADAAIEIGVDGSARVEVPAAIATLGAGPRALALSQLEASLRSLRSLSGVRLMRKGQDVIIDEAGRADRALPGHRPIAAGEAGVVSLADIGAADPPAQLVPALAGMEVASPTIAQDGVLAAARSPEGSTVLIASSDDSVPLREAATGGVFVAPRIDGSGYVWTSVRQNPGAVSALSGTSAERDAKVDAPWLAGREVRALDIAADDTRMLVLSADAGGTRLDLCAVVRDAEGVPASLTDPVVIRPFLDDVTQASWYDEVVAVVLGEDPTTGELRAQLLDLAGEVEPLPTPAAGTERIVGSAVADTLWSSTAAGELRRTDGEGWTTVDLAGRDPSFY